MNIQNTSQEQVNARTHIRGEVALAVDVRVSGGVRTKARMIDLSERGFRMDCMTILPTEKLLFMTIPTFAQLEARIAWRAEWTYGCEFVRPLHTAIYEHILKAHPTFYRPL